MNRFAYAALAALAAPILLAAPAASAAPKAGPATTLPLPAVGAPLALTGDPAAWPKKLDWMYDVPSARDATGKVVLHWFCAPKVTTCTEDLARVVTLKENAKVYVVAYINGSKYEAKKLDPIRESEGVGRGTAAFGRGVAALAKRYGITGPVSIVVGLDGKIAYVTSSTDAADLDARDAKVTALSAAIRDFTSTSDGPTEVKAGASFRLAMTIKLSPWLRFSKRTVPEFQLTGPADIKCNAKALRGAQIKVVEQTLVAELTCSGPKGVYELRGALNFGYDNPAVGGSGLGSDGAKWKFEIKP